MPEGWCGAAVAVSGLVADEDCCNVKFWNYSNQTADSVPLPIDGPVFFASGTAEAVGGSGAASLTVPLQGLQSATFLQEDTFAERRLAVEQEVLRAACCVTCRILAICRHLQACMLTGTP